MEKEICRLCGSEYELPEPQRNIVVSHPELCGFCEVLADNEEE